MSFGHGRPGGNREQAHSHGAGGAHVVSRRQASYGGGNAGFGGTGERRCGARGRFCDCGARRKRVVPVVPARRGEGGNPGWPGGTSRTVEQADASGRSQSFCLSGNTEIAGSKKTGAGMLPQFCKRSRSSMFLLVLPMALVFGAPIVAAQGLDAAALLKPATDTWPSYNGDYSGRRYSTLDQINAGNIHSLTLAWAFNTRGSVLKSTPLEVNGILYFSAP